MKIETTDIPGLLILTPRVFEDSRGYFMESFRENWLEDYLPSIRFVQENESFSKKNVLRGLHYQKSPHEQSKLVRCISGKILDVAVDLRKDSPTYLQSFKIVLSAENKKQFFIPKGMAHGFLTLEENTIVSYKVDDFYSPECERSIRYDDKDLNIDWELEQSPILSDKDAKALLLSELTDQDF